MRLVILIVIIVIEIQKSAGPGETGLAFLIFHPSIFLDE